MTKLPLAFLVIFLLNSATAEAEEHQTRSVKVGLMTELSGPFAYNGHDCKKGWELAKSSFTKDGFVGPTKLEFLYGDTKGTGKDGVTEFSRLVDVQGTDVVIVNRSAVAMSLNPISKRKKLPLIAIAGYHEFTKLNPYAFRHWPTSVVEGRALAEKAFRLGKRRLAAVSFEDEWALSFLESFQTHFQALGGKIVYDEKLLGSDTEFSSIITALKQQQPDSILINLCSGQSGIMIRKLRENGLQQQLFGSYFTTRLPELQIAGPAAEGLRLVELDFEQPKFSAAFQQLFPEKRPSVIVYTCYTALAMLAQAVENIKGEIDRTSLFQALQAIEQLDLPDGSLPVVNREIQYVLSYKIVKNGKAVPVKQPKHLTNSPAIH